MPELVNYTVTFTHEVKVTANNFTEALALADEAMKSQQKVQGETSIHHKASQPQEMGREIWIKR